MTSTKVMFLGIPIMLLGFALVSAATQVVVFRAMGHDSPNLAYAACAFFAVGFIIGVIGLFNKK